MFEMYRVSLCVRHDVILLILVGKIVASKGLCTPCYSFLYGLATETVDLPANFSSWSKNKIAAVTHLETWKMFISFQIYARFSLIK